MFGLFKRGSGNEIRLADEKSARPTQGDTWFRTMDAPKVFVACPSDVGRIRDLARAELLALKDGAADDHGLDVFDWVDDTQEGGFRQSAPAQSQLPLPSDPQCRAVICAFGERIGMPLPNTVPIWPISAQLRQAGNRIRRDWRKDYIADGSFALTGTIFELFSALERNAASPSALEKGNPPILILFYGDETILRTDLDAMDANWGGGELFRKKQSELARSQWSEWEKSEYRPQVEQLRNLISYLESMSISPCIVRNDSEARAKIREFLKSSLGLRDSATRDPFKGLQVYDIADRDIFFGRTQERDAVVSALKRLWQTKDSLPAVGIVGGSGAGKSSLLRAGVLGRLQTEQHPYTYSAALVRAGEVAPPDDMSGLAALATSVLMAAAHGEAGMLNAGAQVKQIIADAKSERVSELLVERTLASLQTDKRARRIIIAFDQFEEFVDQPNHPDYLNVCRFLNAALKSGKIGLVYTLQENRRSLVVAAPTLDFLVKGDMTHIGLPSAQDFADIVEMPFRSDTEIELAPQIAQELRARILQFERDSEQGAGRDSLLPLVSLALHRLHGHVEQLKQQRARAKASINPFAPPDPNAEDLSGPIRITFEDCRDHLQINTAIATLADEAMREAQSGPDWSADTLSSVLRRLVKTESGGRVRLPDAPYPTAEAQVRLVGAMMKRRLVVPTGTRTMRLAHEAIVRHWRHAEQWLDEERDILEFFNQLDAQARAWSSSGRPEAFVAGRGPSDADWAAHVLSNYWEQLRDAAQHDEHGTLRDYCLTLLRQWPTPEKRLRTGNQNTHMHVAALYNDADLIADYARRAPEAVNALRKDQRTPLMIAAFFDPPRALRALLAAGADLATPEAAGWQAIHAAATGGAVETFEVLAAAGADVMSLGPADTTAMHLAANAGHGAIVERLAARAPALIGMPDAAGFTPLHRAAGRGHAETIDIIIRLGAEVEARTTEKAIGFQGRTALHTAAAGNHAEAINALVAGGADVNAPSPLLGPPVHIAAYFGNAAAIAALSACGADIERPIVYEPIKRKPDTTVSDKEKKDWRPLHIAIDQGHPQALKALLSAGANPNALTGADRTPLSLATDLDDAAAIEQLLDRGADIENAATGETPLSRALDSGHQLAADRLVQHRANLYAEDNNGRSLICRAINSNNMRAVRYLLQVGVDPDRPGSDGATPLTLASALGRSELVSDLLHAGADPKKKDADGANALHVASEHGALAILRILSFTGAAVDLSGPLGQTALHLACRRGRLDVVEQLLNNGAKVNVTDDFGFSPLHLAAQADASDVVARLLSVGANPDATSASPMMTPLQAAAEAGATSSALLLAKRRARLAKSTKHRREPLLLAIQNNHFDCALALLEAGAKAPRKSEDVSRVRSHLARVQATYSRAPE